MIQLDETRTAIQEYYGRVLESSSDLRTGACCTPDRLPERLRGLLERIHPDITERFYLRLWGADPSRSGGSRGA